MKTITINNAYCFFPEKWDELTQAQLIGVLGIIDSNFTPDGKRIRLMKLLANMDAFLFCTASMDELQDYFYLLDFLFVENTLTKNLLPEYNGLIGPSNFLQNITVQEYIFSEDAYLKYKHSNDADQLDILIGILYRRPRFMIFQKPSHVADIRQDFNDNILEIYRKRIKPWPSIIKKCILHWYEGCRSQFAVAYPDCFGGSGEPAKRGMLTLAVSMAETGTFGDFSKVEKLLIHTFYIGMDEAAQQAKRKPVLV